MFNFKGIIYFPLELSIYGTNQTIIYEYNDSSPQKVTTEYNNEEINHPQLMCKWVSCPHSMCKLSHLKTCQVLPPKRNWLKAWNRNVEDSAIQNTSFPSLPSDAFEKSSYHQNDMTWPDIS